MVPLGILTMETLGFAISAGDLWSRYSHSSHECVYLCSCIICFCFFSLCCLFICSFNCLFLFMCMQMHLFLNIWVLRFVFMCVLGCAHDSLLAVLSNLEKCNGKMNLPPPSLFYYHLIWLALNTYYFCRHICLYMSSELYIRNNSSEHMGNYILWLLPLILQWEEYKYIYKGASICVCRFTFHHY